MICILGSNTGNTGAIIAGTVIGVALAAILITSLVCLFKAKVNKKPVTREHNYESKEDKMCHPYPTTNKVTPFPVD